MAANPMNPRKAGGVAVPGLALKLLRVRESLEITTLEAAQRAGLSQGSISNVENDKRDPSLATLLKLCKAYGIYLSDLIPVGLSPSDVKTWPDAFCKFVDAQAKIGEKLSDQDIHELLCLKFRGKRPSTANQWTLVYLVMKGFGP